MDLFIKSTTILYTSDRTLSPSIPYRTPGTPVPTLYTVFCTFCFAPKLVNCFVVLPQTETMMDERQRRHATLEAALREVITQVLVIVNEKKDHIPPVLLQPDVVTSFPFEISIPRYKIDCRNTLMCYHFSAFP
jgi:hypothetical protein